MATRGNVRASVSSRDAELLQLEELQSLIVNPEDIGEPLANPDFPDRRLLVRGDLDRVLPTGVVEEGVVILLSDLLLYCLEDAHGMLTVDGVIEITEGSTVTAGKQAGDTGSLFVLNVLSSEGYGYTFVAKNMKEQQYWLNAISDAIQPSAPLETQNDALQAERAYDQGHSQASSRPTSRQSTRTYEQDLTTDASHDADADVNGDQEYDEEVDSHIGEPRDLVHTRNQFREGRPLDVEGGSRSSSRASNSDYKSPDSFLSQHSVSTCHPQDVANEDVLMNQVAALPNLSQVRARCTVV
jgi:hypothetical protein